MSLLSKSRNHWLVFFMTVLSFLHVTNAISEYLVQMTCIARRPTFGNNFILFFSTLEIIIKKINNALEALIRRWFWAGLGLNHWATRVLEILRLQLSDNAFLSGYLTSSQLHPHTWQVFQKVFFHPLGNTLLRLCRIPLPKNQAKSASNEIE